MERYIALDSGPLIIFSQTCYLPIIKFLKEKDINFIAPPYVKLECIDKPMNIDQYKLSAIRIKKLFDEKIVEVKEIDKSELEYWKKLLNSTYYCDGNKIKIVHDGELEALLLAKAYEPHVLAMDERTTRLLLEDPHLLKSRLKRKFRGHVEEDTDKIIEFQKEFHNVLIVRSSELYLLARKLGYPGNNQIDFATLEALKRCGCGISTTEINEYFKYKKKYG